MKQAQRCCGRHSPELLQRGCLQWLFHPMYDIWKHSYQPVSAPAFGDDRQPVLTHSFIYSNCCHLRQVYTAFCPAVLHSPSPGRRWRVAQANSAFWAHSTAAFPGEPPSYPRRTLHEVTDPTGRANNNICLSSLYLLKPFLSFQHHSALQDTEFLQNSSLAQMIFLPGIESVFLLAPCCWERYIEPDF